MAKDWFVEVRLEGEDSTPYSPITSYVQSVHWELGRRRWEAIEDNAHAIIKIRVGRLAAGYMYPLDFNRLRPGLLVRIGYGVQTSMSVAAAFTGYIENITWDGDLMVLRLVTLLELLKGQLVEFDLLSDVDTGEIIETALEAARFAATRDYMVINVGFINSGWISDASLDLDAEMTRDFFAQPGDVSHAYVGDQSQYLVDAWELVKEAVEAESGWLTTLPNGNPFFERRTNVDYQYEGKPFHPVAVLDYATGVTFDYGAEIITRASCTYYTKYLQTSVTLWTLNETVYVANGSPVEIKAVYSDDINQIVGAENAVLGAFTANYAEDGTGIDATSNLTVTKVEDSSTTMTIRFTNTGINDFWVRTGTVTGDRVSIGSPNSVEVVDDNAELAYGVKAFRMRNSIIGRSGDARRMLERIVDRPGRGLALSTISYNSALFDSDAAESYLDNYVPGHDVRWQTSMPGMPDTDFLYVISRTIHHLERVGGRLGNHTWMFELEKANNYALDDS